jgi:uncharacterized protein (DUF885 family)
MKKYCSFILIVALLGCSDNPKNQNRTPSISELADTYYKRYLETYPEWSYIYDIQLEKHDEINSNNLSDIEKWESFEDSLYSELLRIDIYQIPQKKDKITCWLLKEELESNIGIRICKRYLWDVDHMGGWHTRWIKLAEFQPVGSEEFRTQAFDRWKKLPSFIETEIKNLKNGLSTGYSMPKVIVELVIDQLQVLQEYKIEDSPFMSPANRDDNEEFQSKWKKLVADEIIPAILNYQNFLKNEYLDQAREEVSILALPDGGDCYQALIRKNTTTNKTGEEIFNSGQKIVATNKAKVAKLGLELYQTDDFTEIIKLTNSDPDNYFDSSEEVLEVNAQLLSKAKKESEKWFNVLPSTEVTIKPYESHEAGIGSYEEATGDKPAYFRINLNNPEQQKRGENEKLNFHEAYPGHHLQIGIEKDIEGLHSISKFIWFGSYVEGWARYSEQLAEEMGLYENKSALINRCAWPARGMVIDPGLHLLGWSKEEVIAFVTESGYDEAIALSLYHRIIIWPAQLTSYDVGGEEIKALRLLAKQKLGDNFDIKEFHLKILENGEVPLRVLRSLIDEWIDSKSN